jgi:hypothetical protein
VPPVIEQHTTTKSSHGVRLFYTRPDPLLCIEEGGTDSVLFLRQDVLNIDMSMCVLPHWEVLLISQGMAGRIVKLQSWGLLGNPAPRYWMAIRANVPQDRWEDCKSLTDTLPCT